MVVYLYAECCLSDSGNTSMLLVVLTLEAALPMEAREHSIYYEGNLPIYWYARFAKST